MSELERTEASLRTDQRVSKVLDNLKFREDFSDKLMRAEAPHMTTGDLHNPEFDERLHLEQVLTRLEELVAAVGTFENLTQAVRAEAEVAPDAGSRTTWLEVLQQLGG